MTGLTKPLPVNRTAGWISQYASAEELGGFSPEGEFGGFAESATAGSGRSSLACCWHFVGGCENLSVSTTPPRSPTRSDEVRDHAPEWSPVPPSCLNFNGSHRKLQIMSTICSVHWKALYVSAIVGCTKHLWVFYVGATGVVRAWNIFPVRGHLLFLPNFILHFFHPALGDDIWSTVHSNMEGLERNAHWHGMISVRGGTFPHLLTVEMHNCS